MVAATVITNLLLATAALAAPSLGVGLERRAAGHNTTQYSEAAVNNVREVFHENTWAGAIYSDLPDTFTYVSGVFTVPTLTPVSMPYGSAAIAVSIDAVTCPSAIFQAGIDIVLFGEVSYHAWYEWSPAPPQYFSGIDLNVNDTIRLTVITYSSTSGTAIIENETTKQLVSQDFIDASPLCLQDAAWIVQVVAGSPFDFGNFGTVAFTEAGAITTRNGTIGPGNAKIVEIIQDNRVVTSSSVDSSSVTVQYSTT